jgi:hypothetical protein
MAWQTAFSKWFVPAAPPRGKPNPAIAPQGVTNDPVGYSRNFGPGRGLYQTERVHAKSDGYLPSWKFVAPPGVGDAPQHVWTTYSLIPVSLDGPGDRPASYFRWKVPPLMQPFLMRYQGMAVDGGNFLMTGLYTPEPLSIVSPAVYSGAAPYGGG